MDVGHIAPMTLPPNFWTTPNDLGSAGALIGLIIGVPLGFYFFGKRPGDAEYLYWWSDYFMPGLVMMACIFLGMGIGTLIWLFKEGYLP
jgi:hypothetical protein